MSSNETYPIVRFGDVARTVRNIVDPETSGLERYIAGEHMDTDDLRLRRWGTIGDGYLGPAFHMKFEAGQILYGSRRTYLRKVALADFDGICANTTFVIEAIPDRILPDLLPFIMQTESFTQHSILRSRGSTNPYVTWSDIARYEFPLPPLDEQRRIAEILWAVEDAIDAYTVAFDQLQQSKHVTLSDLFPDPRQISTEYRTAALKEVCEMQEGRVFPSTDYTEAGIKLLRPGNLAPNGYLDWNENATRFLPEEYLENYPDYLIVPDDIVINLTAQSLEDGFMGRVCKAGSEDYCLLNQRLGRFIAKDGLHLDFLFRYLQTSYFRRHAESHCEGSKIKHLYWRHLQNFCIEVPPMLIQEKKIQIAQELDNAVSKLRSHIENLAKLRVSLRENMLAGIALDNYV